MNSFAMIYFFNKIFVLLCIPHIDVIVGAIMAALIMLYVVSQWFNMKNKLEEIENLLIIQREKIIESDIDIRSCADNLQKLKNEMLKYDVERYVFFDYSFTEEELKFVGKNHKIFGLGKNPSFDDLISWDYNDMSDERKKLISAIDEDDNKIYNFIILKKYLIASHGYVCPLTLDINRKMNKGHLYGYFMMDSHDDKFAPITIPNFTGNFIRKCVVHFQRGIGRCSNDIKVFLSGNQLKIDGGGMEKQHGYTHGKGPNDFFIDAHFHLDLV